MIQCPLCSLPVAGQRGLASHFRHQAKTHPDYKQWKADQRWAGKVEGEDYVRCLECGYRAASLARHMKAVHGITADGYRVLYPDALIRPSKVTAKRSKAIRERKGGFGKGEMKDVVCPACGAIWVGSKFLVPGTHDLRCSACREAAGDVLWASQVEGTDYVVCLECGHRAENLTSHIQAVHSGYREKYPDAQIVALNSAVRDKTALKGLRRSPEFCEKVREAKTLGFILADFEPYLEFDGSVDHRAARTGLRVSWPTLREYMDTLGLAATGKYVAAAAAERVVCIEKDVLEGFQLKNGKVSIARAVSGLGYCNITIKRECTRHGLVWAHGNISQRFCLDAVSEALGGLRYEEEWKLWRFTNPLTGHRFRFDGYFPDLGLVVEFQGHQHYTFPNAYMVDESYLPEWEALVERDRVKRELITAAPDLIWFEVREDEPFTDVMYLRGRLKEVLGLDQVG